jgi:hypothetical protein
VERTNRPLSAERQAIEAVFAQTCMGVFFIRTVSETIFAMAFP